MEGNLMMMREAVVALLDALESLGCDENTAALAAFVPDMADSSAKCLVAFHKAKEALSAPRRNCDVGTVEEQRKKFRLFCESHKPVEPEFTETGELLCTVSGCELGVCNYGQCALKWAQTPYEEGGAK